MKKKGTARLRPKKKLPPRHPETFCAVVLVMRATSHYILYCCAVTIYCVYAESRGRSRISCLSWITISAARSYSHSADIAPDSIKEVAPTG